VRLSPTPSSKATGKTPENRCGSAGRANAPGIYSWRSPMKATDSSAISFLIQRSGQNLFSTHGRGVFLIRHIMDSVEFRLGGRQIVMRKRL